jgi:hypothetical protein
MTYLIETAIPCRRPAVVPDGNLGQPTSERWRDVLSQPDIVPVEQIAC